MKKFTVLMIEKYSSGYVLSSYNPKTGRPVCHAVNYSNNGKSEKDNFDEAYNEAQITKTAYLDCGMDQVIVAIKDNVPKNVIDFPEFETIMSEEKFESFRSEV